MVYGLDVVAVGIAQEHAVAIRVVLRPQPRGMENLGSRCPGRFVDRHGDVDVGGLQTQMVKHGWDPLGARRC